MVKKTGAKLKRVSKSKSKNGKIKISDKKGVKLKVERLNQQEFKTIDLIATPKKQKPKVLDAITVAQDHKADKEAAKQFHKRAETLNNCISQQLELISGFAL